MNKKGSFLLDLPIFIILALIIAFFSGMMYFIADTTQDKLLELAPKIQSSKEGATNITELMQDTVVQTRISYESLKWITVMLIMGMALSIFIGGYMVTIRPVFLVAYIFIMIIMVIISAPISNVYEKVYLDPILASSFSGFWGQNYIFLHLPIWILVIGTIAGIIMFVNMKRNEGFGGGF